MTNDQIVDALLISSEMFTTAHKMQRTENLPVHLTVSAMRILCAVVQEGTAAGTIPTIPTDTRIKMIGRILDHFKNAEECGCPHCTAARLTDA